MKVIKPIAFTTAMLLSSNATETVAAYNAATTYAKDAEVNYSNSIYVSLAAANTGNQPDISPTWWIRKSANNKYSMFDEFVNTQTTRTSSLTVDIDPGSIFNSLAIFNMSGVTTLKITVKDGVSGPVLYNQTFNLDNTIIVDWYMYFFEPYDIKSELVIQDIPPYSTGVITAVFTGAASVSVGNFIFGSVYMLGQTQYGSSGGIRDYSVKEVNAYGITTFVKRAFSKRMESTLYIDQPNLRYTRKLLEDIRATPVVWIGSDDSSYDIMSIFGYYRDFNIEITYPSYSLCRLEIEGLI